MQTDPNSAMLFDWSVFMMEPYQAPPSSGVVFGSGSVGAVGGLCGAQQKREE